MKLENNITYYKNQSPTYNSSYLLYLNKPTTTNLIKTNPNTSNIRSNLHYQQQKEQSCSMTNEEARSLTGVVAKTRALFESSNQNSTPILNYKKPQYSTPQINKQSFATQFIKQSQSAFSINYSNNNRFTKTNSTSNENDSDKENTTQGLNLNKIRSQLNKVIITNNNNNDNNNNNNNSNNNNTRHNKSNLFENYSNDNQIIKPSMIKKFEISSSLTNNENNNKVMNRNLYPIKKSYSSHRLSSSLNDENEQNNFHNSNKFNANNRKSRINSSTSNILLNKSEEISKELNIPLSVKQAKACFENLAQMSQSSRSVSNLTVSSSRSNNKSNLNIKGTTPVKINNRIIPDYGRNLITTAPDTMMNSMISSSSSTSSDLYSSINNQKAYSSESSSCESTPRLLNNFKPINSKQNMISSVSSSSSSSSTSSSVLSNNSSPISTVKYSNSSKFLQLYQRQMEISCMSKYRKLEDIINEADKSISIKTNTPTPTPTTTTTTTTTAVATITRTTSPSTNIEPTNDKNEEKKLKSILRKASSQQEQKQEKEEIENSDQISAELKIQTKTARSSSTSSTSSSSSSCSPSSSTSSLNKKQVKELPEQDEIVKVDNTSCVLPSKLRQRTQSLGIANQTTNQTNNQATTIITQINNTNLNKTPVRNVGAYIKNVSNSCGNSSNSGLVKRVTRNAANAREALLRWCRKQTEEYDKISINNFSSSWSDGRAFCALIHHFMPNEFDFNQLDDSNPRYNFELAFKTAEEKAGIISLLDVDDMIEMGNSPDWKCVFTYVHSIYQRFKEVS